MDDLSPSARALLDAAGPSDDPTPDDARRVRHAVLLRVGAVGLGTATLASNTAQAKGLFSTLGAKLGAALVVVIGASTATYVATRPEPLTPLVVAPKSVSDTPAPVREAKPETPEEPQAPLLEAVPEPEARPARPLRVGEPKAEIGPNLEAEMKLIRSADAALRAGRTSEAVSLLAEHHKQHPQGLLSQEREGLGLIARCQSGGSAGASRAADSFLTRAPRSPLAPRVRSACGK